MKQSSLGIVLLAVLALALAVVANQTRLGRMSNIDVPEAPFEHVYVLTQVGSDEKCLVTDRQGATLRRSEPKLAGSRWRCRWTTATPDPQATGDRRELLPPSFLALTGKEPSYLFVPAERVDDPVFPWAYEAVRRGFADYDNKLLLPRLRWVHLFFDRQYRGLFLELRLPDRRFAENRGLDQVELLSARDHRLHCWNRKLRPTCTLLSESFIAEAIFPRPTVTDAVAWLESLLPAERSRAFYLAAVPPSTMGRNGQPGAGRSSDTGLPSEDGHLLPLPLPFALEEILGAERQFYVDDRVRSWSEPGPGAARALPELEDLPSAESAVETLRIALAAHRRARPSVGDSAGNSGRDSGTGSAEGGVDGAVAGDSLERRLETSPTLAWLRARSGASASGSAGEGT